LRIGADTNIVDYYKYASTYNSLQSVDNNFHYNTNVAKSLISPKLLINLYRLLKSPNLKGLNLLRKALIFKISKVEITKLAALRLRRYKLNNTLLYTKADRGSSASTLFNYGDINNLNLIEYTNMGKKDISLVNNI
jgi:hypothetical protein